MLTVLGKPTRHIDTWENIMTALVRPFTPLLRTLPTRAAKAKSTSIDTSNVMDGVLYNATSAGQLAAHAVTYPALDIALGRLQQLPATTLEVQDLGCSAGANAVAFADRLVHQLHNCWSDRRDVRYSFIDLPSNDWSQMTGRACWGWSPRHRSCRQLPGCFQWPRLPIFTSSALPQVRCTSPPR